MEVVEAVIGVANHTSDIAKGIERIVETSEDAVEDIADTIGEIEVAIENTANTVGNVVDQTKEAVDAVVETTQKLMSFWEFFKSKMQAICGGKPKSN